MRRGSATIVLAATAALAAGASAQDAERAYKEVGTRASRPVATISYGADPLQVADLRLPAGRRPAPVVILIHGGCWRSDVDTRAGIAGFADALGRRGFATWNIEYRRLGDAGGGWPGTFEDVAAAVDKLAETAPRYRLDVTRVVIVGHSAGAHLALWAASRARLPAPWSATKVRPLSVVAIDGPAALAPFIGLDAQACGRPVIVPLMGGTPADRAAEYRIASPADHLPLGLHQLSVGAEFAPLMRPYVEAARAGGDRVDAFEPANANHFDIVTPGTPNGEAVADFIAAKALQPAPPSRRPR